MSPAPRQPPHKQAAHHHREVCAASQSNGLDAEEGEPSKRGRAESVYSPAAKA